jgi:hypothetical protein
MQVSSSSFSIILQPPLIFNAANLFSHAQSAGGGMGGCAKSAVGRLPHFSLFRPNFCWRRGAVSSFFAFPTQLLLAPRGGFFIFCFSDPTFVGAAGRFPHFLLFRPNFC